MTGFDETVPLDPDPDRDATAARNARDHDLTDEVTGDVTRTAGDRSVDPGPDALDADEGEPDVVPFAGS